MYKACAVFNSAFRRFRMPTRCKIRIVYTFLITCFAHGMHIHAVSDMSSSKFFSSCYISLVVFLLYCYRMSGPGIKCFTEATSTAGALVALLDWHSLMYQRFFLVNRTFFAVLFPYYTLQHQLYNIFMGSQYVFLQCWKPGTRRT